MKKDLLIDFLEMILQDSICIINDIEISKDFSGITHVIITVDSEKYLIELMYHMLSPSFSIPTLHRDLLDLINNKLFVIDNLTIETH